MGYETESFRIWLGTHHYSSKTLGDICMTTNEKVKVATMWLSGCSGCHMSFLDLAERLVELKYECKLEGAAK